MDNADRRKLLSSVGSNSDANASPGGLGGLSEGFADAYAGVRSLDLPITPASASDVDESEAGRAGIRIDARVVAIALGVFLLAAVPRLLVLFNVTDLDNPGVGWYNDTFHHWQIAYLSKEIGFHQGFLRLWDFKGLEYFWGLLHPLLLIGVFTITGSIDIVIPRMLSLLAGSGAVVVLFFLLRRHFGIHVALAGTLFAALNPVEAFADTAGLLQPIAMFLMLLGLWLWPRRAVWAGFSWALAGLVRAEYWVFGAGLLLVSMFSDEQGDHKLGIVLGWLVPILAYMRYLAVHTGNPIYPVYWNFLGNAAGEWMGDRPLGPLQVALQLIGRAVTIIGGAAAIWIVAKRRKSYLVELFGIGNVMFVGMVFGFSAYIHGVLPRILHARLLIVPYLTLAVLVALALFRWLTAKLGSKPGRAVGWAVFGCLLVASQLAWQPILATYEKGKPHWEATKTAAHEIATYYSTGTVSIPEDRPLLTYSLVRYEGLQAQELQGQMYDPFAYFNDGDPFAHWQENRKAIADWLNRFDITLLVYNTGKQTYDEMVQREPGWFEYLGSAYEDQYQIYRVLSPVSG